MSDTGFQDDPQDHGEGQVDGDPNIRQLREKAKRADELEAKVAASERRIAVLESGIDVETPVGELFLKAYDGDVTPEAMKAAAEKYGVPFKHGQNVEVEETPEPDESTEPTGTAERRALADGAPADTGEDMDPRQMSINRFNELMKEGRTEEDAAAESISVLAQAAMRGDKRVIYEPPNQ